MKKIFFSTAGVLLLIAMFVQNTQAVENNYSDFLNVTEGKNQASAGRESGVLPVNQEQKTELIIFVREGCHVCHQEKEFLTTNEIVKSKFDVSILDIGDKNNKEKWKEIVNKHKLSKVTPITLIGGDVLVGFNQKITEKKILQHQTDHKKYGINFYFKNQENNQQQSAEYTCNAESTSTCTISPTDATQKKITTKQKNAITSQNKDIMTLPFFGEINIKNTSILIMSSVLGFIDGFNPCAMWVLLTFLIILSQIGDRKKMIYLAGLFIVAEGIMYFLILNVWYQTWDFIQLDQWVTPLVGTIAIGGGLYFLYKYFKNRGGKIACEVTSLEHQQKTVAKIKEVVTKPITIITTLAVLGIAFSVNIIEFACSVGIAQSFTKILELNHLNFFIRQWYIFIYSLFYMADDFLIFGLAIFGYQKFATIGTKYSHLSSLLGGILMLILGFLLIFHPELLAG